MSLRNVLPHIIQPFRPRHVEQRLQPVCLGPLDVLKLMEFVEKHSESRPRSFIPGAFTEDMPIMTPEPGFRY